MPKTVVSEKSASDEAMKFLRYRDHTGVEVREHLKKKGYKGEEIEPCMESLIACHFIDDNRYCENYLRYSVSKGKGPLRIRQELLKKGVSNAEIQIHMEESFDHELEFSQALKQAEKLTNGLRPDEKQIAKIGRRLAYLGYSTAIIYRILDQLR